MNTKGYNKSLSSRVRRRNKNGFSGNGTAPVYEKTNNYGNYRETSDNNKDEISSNAYNNAVNTAKKYYHKHAGSKPWKKLLKVVHDLCAGVKDDMFTIIAKRKAQAKIKTA